MDFVELCSRKGARVYFVGIKGTGMCALAELLNQRGLEVSGSDTSDVFYTDDILKARGIPFYESFEAHHLSAGIELVIYSVAYSPDTNSELVEAKRRGIPLLKYSEALGAYSARFDASGIAGVHGKTTTTAITGTLIKALALPAQILAGSAVSGFGGGSVLNLGNKYFVAETCEYRRNFLSFHPRRILITSVESDHQDYYPTYQSIRDAFLEYLRLLPPEGELIYCADDPGAAEIAALFRQERPALRQIPYGLSVVGPFGIESLTIGEEQTLLKLRCFPETLRLRIPGRHSALDAAAALALTDSLLRRELEKDTVEIWKDTDRRERVRKALEDFRGSKRRTEILGEEGGILFIDDYGHHPTAIRTTLEGLRSFYPRRRLIISFMSHTYTRTASLLDEFAAAFEAADMVIFHKIYGSAREYYEGGVTGKTLYEKALFQPSGPAGKGGVFYVEEPLEAVDMIRAALREGDIFLTLGAGDNEKLGHALLSRLKTPHAGKEGRGDGS